MTLYGAGSMLGAGIYGLVGQVAAEMGSAIWLAFLLSLVAAGLTGLSYASLGSRYPRAGGAAYITQRAYRHRLLTHVVGLTVACSGFTSIAARARVAHALSIIHPVRRTPHVAIGLIFVLIVILILSGDISQLASATALLLLLVFSVVNSALIILKLRPGEPRGAFELPLAVPALAAVVCVALFLARSGAGDWRAPMIAGVLLLGVGALYLWLRPRLAAKAG